MRFFWEVMFSLFYTNSIFSFLSLNLYHEDWIAWARRFFLTFSRCLSIPFRYAAFLHAYIHACPLLYTKLPTRLAG